MKFGKRLVAVQMAWFLLVISGCGGGGGGGTNITPSSISNLQYTPATANATLDTISVSGSIEFNSSADKTSLKLTDSNGTDRTVPISATSIRVGRVNVPPTPIPGIPVGFYKFTVWLLDANGTESNKLTGQIEIKRVPLQASAGPDLPTNLNVATLLDGSASKNVNGTATTFAWSVVNPPITGSVSLSTPTTATTNVTCSTAGKFDIQLQISDGTGPSATDSVAISCITSDRFTLGSLESDVQRLAGTPASISNFQLFDYYEWRYSDSITSVQFSKSTGRVIAWRSYDVILPAAMAYRAANSSINKIVIGSTKDDVARIQGVPLALKDTGILDYDEWRYDKIGLTYIRFSKKTGLVAEYRNYDGSLKI